MGVLKLGRPPRAAGVKARGAWRGVLDFLHQVWLCLSALGNFLCRPTSRQTFTALSEMLVRSRANRDAVDFMLRDARVLQLCRERYLGTPYTPAVLIKHPPGSLGHELAAAMIERNYDPDFHRSYYRDDVPVFETDEEYLRFRVRQTHDIVHILTGFSMDDFPGELGMQAFHAAQTRRPFSIALLGFGMLRMVLKPDELPGTLHQVAKGLSMGFATQSLVGLRFEEDWSKPVAQWRRELGLVHEQAFRFDAAPAPGKPQEPAPRTAWQGADPPGSVSAEG
jgi:ubiquinone biosynthesis protein COQ4